MGVEGREEVVVCNDVFDSFAWLKGGLECADCRPMIFVGVEERHDSGEFGRSFKVQGSLICAWRENA